MVVDRQRLKEVWDDEALFTSRLLIENHLSKLQRLDPLFGEQVAYAHALANYKRVVAIKPRAVGFTTLSALKLFAKTYRSRDPRRVLQTVHDPFAHKRIRRIVETAYEGLPRELRFGLRESNAETTEFAHNRAGFDRLIAGKRGQGRGGTYTDYHATEMAFYPEGSSALKHNEEKVDTDLFSAIQATLHDPEGHIIVESTGNGPRGLFYEMVKEAAEGRTPDVGFVFVPWSIVARYRMPVPPGFEPDDDERKLMLPVAEDGHGLDLEQLAWRRHKLTVGRYTLVRFQREYPLTWGDPFLLSSDVWFSSVALNNVLKMVGPPGLRAPTTEPVIFAEPEAGRTYFVALDPSGGVGRDEAALQVTDDLGRHAATWASNTASLEEQTLMAARLCGLYANALLLIEGGHGYGEKCIELARKMGLRLWKDAEGDSFNPTTFHKVLVLIYARSQIDGMWTAPRDPATVLQLMNIVEKAPGKVEGRGVERDDRAMAYCYSLWCARLFVLRAAKIDPAEEHRKHLAAMAQHHERFFQRGHAW